MNTAKRKFTHGPDAGKLMLGLWLFVSPWMLNYSQVRVPVWNGDAVGFVVAAFSIAAMLKFTTWEEWGNMAAGFRLIASPWILDYTSLLGNTRDVTVRGQSSRRGHFYYHPFRMGAHYVGGSC
jgi:hypothetical protein